MADGLTLDGTANEILKTPEGRAAAARELVRQIGSADAIALLNSEAAAAAQEIDDAKPQPMRAHSLPAADWATFKSYMMDGGGLDQDRQLMTTIAQALHDDDQVTFWNSVFHLVKAGFKTRGMLRAIINPDGSTALIWNGVGPKPPGPK